MTTPDAPDAPELHPEVTVYISPVDVAAHPTYPPGYRWAVHVGGTPPTDLDHCAMAGWEADQGTAGTSGEMVGAAITRALRMLGIATRYSVQTFGWDPVPADADDTYPLAVWTGEEK